MPITIDCFKAYDVRGQIPSQLNADICYRIGNATAEFLEAGSIVVGRDMRLSSNEFADAVSRGLTDAGVDVFDIDTGRHLEVIQGMRDPPVAATCREVLSASKLR